MSRNQRLVLLFALAVVAWVQLGYRLGEKGLWSRGEGRVALIARTMLDEGDLVVPRAGERLVLTKPPMTHWIVAGSLAAAGPSESSARFPIVVLAACIIALAGWIAARVYGEGAGWMSAFVLASTPHFGWQARTLQIDMVLAFFVVASLAAWLAWQRARTPHAAWGWRLLGWTAVAGAILTKGPVGLLMPAGIVLLADRRTRPAWAGARRGGSWFGPASWLVVLVLVTPWVVALVMRLGGAAVLRDFFGGDLGAELGYAQPEGESQPFWYYLPRVLGDLLPWSLFLPLAAGAARRLSDDAPLPRARRIVPAWFWVVVVGYSLLGKKTARYLIPAYPAAAILAAAAWADARGAFPEGRRRVVFTMALVAVGVVICVVAAVLADIAGANGLLSWSWVREHLSQKDLWTVDALRPVLRAHRAAVFTAVGALGALAVAALVAWRSRRVLATFGCLVGGMTLATLLYYGAVVPVMDASRTTKPMALAIRAELQADESCAVIGRNEYSFAYPLPFYVGRPVAWYRDVDTFLAALEPGARIAVALRDRDEDRLRSESDLRISEVTTLPPFRQDEYRLVRVNPRSAAR